MQRPADRSVEVELVEDDPLDDAGPGREPSPSPLWSLLSRIPREVAVTAVLAVGLAGAGVAVAREGAERALDARLAEVPGLTGSLEAPLREDWRVRGGGVVATVDDLLLHWGGDGLGVVATDLRDGSTRYTAPGACQLAPTEGDLVDRYARPGSSSEALPGDVLLCLEGEGVGPFGGSGAREAAAHVVDPATGRTRHTIAMVAGDTWDVVDGDVVTIGLDAERRAVAGRWSLRTGEERWTYHGTEPAPESGSGWGSTTGDGLVGLEVGTWSVTLDARTGVETDRSAGAGGVVGGQRVGLPDGGSLEYGASSSGDPQTTVHPADGGAPVTVPGIVPAPAVDDGSLPGAVVALDVTGRAGDDWELGLVDLASGERRWTSPVQGGEIGVLSGMVLVADGSRTVAIDARTGEVRWGSAPAATEYFAGWEIVTDGRRVLVAQGAGADREIVALDVRTGERVWGVEPPVRDGALVPLPDGTVLVVGSSEMVALRP